MAENGTAIRYNNAIQIYDRLYERSENVGSSTLVEFGYPAEEGVTVRVYRGYSTKETADMGLLKSSAHHAMQLLKAMRAVTLIRQGTKSTVSVYILNYRPTLEQYTEFTGRSLDLERKYSPTLYDQLVNHIAELRDTIRALQEVNQYNRDILISLEKRVTELERRLPLA